MISDNKMASLRRGIARQIPKTWPLRAHYPVPRCRIITFHIIGFLLIALVGLFVFGFWGHIIRGVLVSTVNSCPTFLSWGWWCTKGKGKVNRCCAKSPKKKQHIPAHRLLIIGSFVLISLSYDFFLQDIRNQKKTWDSIIRNNKHKTNLNMCFSSSVY